jgi:integrase
VRITDTWLKAVKPLKERYDVTVTNRKGLMVRVHPSGAVSFRFRYKRAGETFVLVFGEYGSQGLSLKQAFQRHDQARSELENGLDPIEEQAKREREVERKRAERSGTVADLVTQFVHRKLKAERWDEKAGWVREPKAKPRKRPDEAAALLGLGPNGKKATLVSEYGTLSAHDLTRRQLIAFLDSVVDRGAPVSANRMYSLFKQLFDWAAAKDLIPASPMAGIERPSEETPRERVLNATEIKAFWDKLDTANMVSPTRLALKLLLVTAQRRGELTFAKWSHFDLPGKLWTIPSELIKSSKRAKPDPHTVPLSPLAIDLLEQLHAITGEGVYVLPAHADKTKAKSYSERVLSRAVRENEAHFGLEHFTPHDLRRTAASFMTKIGVPRLHVEKVLNHATGDIAAIYDRHDYSPEKRAALDKWSAHLTDLLASKDNVISIPRPKARRSAHT